MHEDLKSLIRNDVNFKKILSREYNLGVTTGMFYGASGVCLAFAIWLTIRYMDGLPVY